MNHNFDKEMTKINEAIFSLRVPQSNADFSKNICKIRDSVYSLKHYHEATYKDLQDRYEAAKLKFQEKEEIEQKKKESSLFYTLKRARENLPEEQRPKPFYVYPRLWGTK
jgi:hypothetical protein